MTKHNWNIEPIPGFSCVQMKQDIQAKIYEETKDFSPEQRRERNQLACEKFWGDIRERKTQGQLQPYEAS